MRLFIPAIAALAFAAPALAQPSSLPTDDEIVASLPHPFDIEDAGSRLGAAVGAIVNLPIGDVARAIDPTGRADPDQTLADVAGRNDPDFEGRLQDEVAGLTTGAADMVRQIAVVAPALRRSMVELERNFDDALRGARR